MSNVTKSQAVAELARRKANHVKGAKYQNAKSEAARALGSAELREIAGLSKEKKAPESKAVKVKIRVAKKSKVKPENQVFAQVKAALGVKAAFQARRQYLLNHK